MRPMAPPTSEFRQERMREPTDLEKTMRIARHKRKMAQDRLENKQPVPTFAPDSPHRESQQLIQRINNRKSNLGYAWPVPVPDKDSDNSNNIATRIYNEEVYQTKARPEPSPAYKAQYTALMTEIDNLATKQANLERELKEINDEIIALENKGGYSGNQMNELYTRAKATFLKLEDTRNKLASYGKQLEETGAVLRNRTTFGSRIVHGGGGMILGAVGFYALYRLFRPGGRLGGTRKSMNVTKDPLAVFGRL